MIRITINSSRARTLGSMTSDGSVTTALLGADAPRALRAASFASVRRVRKAGCSGDRALRSSGSPRQLTSTPQPPRERPQASAGAPYSSGASCCAGPCPRAPGMSKTIDPAGPGSIRLDSSAGWSIAATDHPVSLPEGTRCCCSIPTESVPSRDHAIDTPTAAARRWCPEAAMSRRRCLPRDLCRRASACAGENPWPKMQVFP